MENRTLVRKILKMSILCAFIAIINILAFSKAFFGISIHSGDRIAVTCSIFIPLMSCIVFGYGSYTILNASEKIKYHVDIAELKDSKDYEEALRRNEKALPFLSKELKTLEMQIQRMGKKQQALLEYLKQNNKDEQFLGQEAENARLFLLNNVKM